MINNLFLQLLLNKCLCLSGFSSKIHQNIQKNIAIGECAGVPGNYSIFEL